MNFNILVLVKESKLILREFLFILIFLDVLLPKICHKEMNLRAQELPIKAYVNSHTNNSITTIDVDKVSANYPYLKRLAPNIDFKLKTIIKKFNNNSCHLSFEGTHDLFPAYELIIQDR